MAYRTGGTAAAVIDGRTGYLVSTGNVADLADKLERLLHSAELRARMGEAGRRFVEGTFTLDAWAARHEEFYADAPSQSGNQTSSRRKRLQTGSRPHLCGKTDTVPMSETTWGNTTTHAQIFI